MKRQLCLIAIIFLSLSGVRAHAQDHGIVRFGVYVVASDMEKSRRFYEGLFQKKPYIKNDRFVGFEVAGSLYGIFAASAYPRKLIKGNNAVPYVRVTDIEKEFERVRKSGAGMVHKKIVQEGPVRLFMFADPDGNLIEFFSLAASPPFQIP